jgi:hypothetical protein
MLALLAALAFLIGWVVSWLVGDLTAKTWQFWFEIGLILWAAHFAVDWRTKKLR